ncbi:uncharacterized protein LOC133789837 [Humulus lupulus]|uniref:uncharacterized protein LOC133789837 n=1 Tax=Humulus lupulus TaxID=3486 RepID=UPI002B40E174|nr:uncharacterized protein LOC133789837 [Humulus lupulus]
MNFVDKDSDILHIEPVKPTPVESTLFKFVEEVKDLKNLAAKLHAVNEFACQLFNISYCPPTEEDIPEGKSLVVVAYNPFGWPRTDIVKIPVDVPIQQSYLWYGSSTGDYDS